MFGMRESSPIDIYVRDSERFLTCHCRVEYLNFEGSTLDLTTVTEAVTARDRA